MDDLKDGIVSNAPDAERVALATQSLAAVLVRDDPRVQSTYGAWRARCEEDARADAADNPTAVERGLVVDVLELGDLVKALGLSRYRWLPQLLFFEFVRTSSSDIQIELSLPAGLDWSKKGRAPKRGAVHTEDIARDVEWFYRTRVKDPRDTPYSIAKAYERSAGISEAKSYVRNRICRRPGATCADTT